MKKTIITTDVPPSELSEVKKLIEMDQPFSIKEVKQDDGKFTIITIFERPPYNHLGKLSEKFESNGDPSAIGYDETGGWSFGTYQLASKKGTISEFLSFLQTNNRDDFYNELNGAGGDAAARAGDSAFKFSWKKLAENPAFDEIQYEFIKQKYYDVQVAELQKIGLDINSRSVALQNVIWSVAVQHGPNTKLIQVSLKGRDLSTLSDDFIINYIYDERSKIDLYFSASNTKVKEAVKNRFIKERTDAITMLA